MSSCQKDNRGTLFFIFFNSCSYYIFSIQLYKKVEEKENDGKGRRERGRGEGRRWERRERNRLKVFFSDKHFKHKPQHPLTWDQATTRLL